MNNDAEENKSHMNDGTNYNPTSDMDDSGDDNDKDIH